MSSRLEFVEKWEALAKEAGYRPQQLASLCQISLRTLQRHFNKNYGVTVSQWLRELRLREAYSRLQGGTAVKVVAFDLGFKQMSHFSREFKNHFGVCPSLLVAQRRIERVVPIRQVSPTSPQMIFTF